MASTSASRSRAELAFLPAALEIVETPPSPIGRAIAITVIVVTCLAATWAALGTVDIVSVAPGKIIPSGRTKLVQPLEPGIVRAIHVRDGQRVRAGDVLIELDPTVSTAELGGPRWRPGRRHSSHQPTPQQPRPSCIVACSPARGRNRRPSSPRSTARRSRRRRNWRRLPR
jgi:hypothetical protein